MKIQNDDIHSVGFQSGDFIFHCNERIFQRWLNETSTLSLNDRHFAFPCFQHHTAISWSPFGVIDRSQQTGFGWKIIHNLLLIPNMISGRDDCRARPQQINRNLRSDPLPARRILAIDDAKIQALGLFKERQLLDDRLATGLADHIAEE